MEAWQSGNQEDSLMHYGVKYRSGRYPYGSGEEPYQHDEDFLARLEELRSQGLDEKGIAEHFKIPTTELRLQERVAKHFRRNLEVERAKALKEDGLNTTQIAKIMGYKNESSIRALLDENTYANKNKAANTANILKEKLEKEKMVDIGAGVEVQLGVSDDKLREAARILQLEGYNVYGIGIPNATNKGKQTIMEIVARPEVTQAYAYSHPGEIAPLFEYYSEDGGSTFKKLQYPASLDGSRTMVRYGDQGGKNKDGVIEIRPGVKDLSLGKSHYAQVRILVDGDRYMKGMAMYGDPKDFPPGVDVIYNSNKSSDVDKRSVFKKIKNDPENPFGAAIKLVNGQSYYIDDDGKEKLSPINKLKEEGEWEKMSKNLSSQFLSKQPLDLISKQLNLTYSEYEEEYDEISNLTLPPLKKKMLMDYAANLESAAVHLKAASLPRQTSQVILPIDSLKDDEIFAPNFKDGEKVALIRYPHAGIFEIPILKVNNKHPQAIASLGKDITDAVGINSTVAEQLSGADFDGDSVVVIPTNSKVKIASRKPFDELKNFNHLDKYSLDDKIRPLEEKGLSDAEIAKAMAKQGYKLMTEDSKQKQMGIISNLITDMTLQGAPESDIIKAVKHSMVVIDAPKHHLDYQRSEIENDIDTLKKRWQIRVDENGDIAYGGASTLLSRRKQTIQVPETQGSGKINRKGYPWYDPSRPEGELVYKKSGRTYVDEKTGEVKAAKKDKSLILDTLDVNSLSSGTAQEKLYAEYANKLKALARKCRLEADDIPTSPRNVGATEEYSEEVKSLKDKLAEAQTNAPRERHAQVLTRAYLMEKELENPELKTKAMKKERKKIAQQAISKARIEAGAKGKETRFSISDREWDAIMAGAISETTLRSIFRYTDQEKLRERATPKSANSISAAKESRARQMRLSGYTNEQIAEALGISRSAVISIFNPKE